jgi:hypothetical protein
MKTAQIILDHSCQIMLRLLWNDSQGWMNAANGTNKLYSLPIARMLARDNARASLDKYFTMIDNVVLKKNGEVA